MNRRRRSPRWGAVSAGSLALGLVLSGCGGSSSPSDHPSATPSVSHSPDAASFLSYLHSHGIPPQTNSKRLVKLGYTFVCASYRYHETTPQILRVAGQHGLHPRRNVVTLVQASVAYLCPQYRSQAGR